MKKISLRMRITVMIGFIIFVTSLVTSLYSIHNSNRSMTLVEDTIQTNPLPENFIDVAEIEASPEFYYSEDVKQSEEYTKRDIYAQEIEKQSRIAYDFYSEQLAVSVTTFKDKFQMSQILFSLMVSLGGMIVSYFMSGFLLRPIRRLADEVSGIEGKDLDKVIEIYNPKDEIGILTKSFNEMMERKKEYVEKQKLFSSNVAHELKTPLAIMKTSIQVLDEDSTKEEYIEAFEMQEKNIDRLTNTINDLLLMCEDRYEVGMVDVKEVVEEVLKEQDAFLKEKGIHLHLDLKEVKLDSSRELLHRLISNLVRNATKYNKKDGSIYLELDERHLVVRDTGIGMEEKYLKDIFEPMFCINKSRSRDLGGSGLGLSIVKNICQILGYGIEVHSKPEFGSEFIVDFRQCDRSGVE